MLITEIKIGDRMKIPVNQKFHPEHGHSGKVVYISEDRKTVAVQCEEKHDGKTISVMVKIN
ncbi:MAG: hypothetical protein JSV75_01175 [Candidatus Bathyarchaeota archaeon]|nr:MAG: hypothetical protein JSV75_01175 [Candidatus Bathyarchaeota archaeon]